MDKPTTTHVRAPAKINLTLEILGKRADGYHLLRSLLVPITLFDDVEMSLADGIESEVIADEISFQGGDLLPTDSENLATRAATLLKEVSGCSQGAKIRITKRIPIGAGLGGGSGNAAATLIGLNLLWDCGLSTADLMELGAQVGSDVPAMVHGGLVSVEGVGDSVMAVDLEDSSAEKGWWLVLVNPGFGVSTADVFSRCDSVLTSGSQVYNNMRFALSSRDVVLAGKSLQNDLQAVVSRKFPIIGIVLDAIADAGSVGTLLSGSGASCFGLAENEEHARELAAAIQKSLGNGFWIKVVKTMPDGVMATHDPLTVIF